MTATKYQLLSMDSTDSLAQRYALSGDKSVRLDIVEDVLYSYMTILGDAIVLWRVWAFWSEGNDRYALVLPLAAYLTSIVASGLVTYCAARSDADIILGGFLHPPFCQNVQWSSYWVQVATAGVATSLIGYKTWKYRRLVKPYLENSDVHRSAVHGAMMIILDTGIIYTLYFCAEAITGSPSLNRSIRAIPSLSFALEIYQFTASSIVGIYPTIVVILVHTHCTLVDSYGHTTVSTIEFQHSRARPMEFRPDRSAGWSDNFPSAPEAQYDSEDQRAEIRLQELDSVRSRSPKEKLEFVKDAKAVDFLDIVQDVEVV